MQPFLILSESDIFENPAKEPEVYVSRPTAKGFVIDNEGNIALLHVHDVCGLPGGGIEEHETPEVAFVREILEEIGCNIQIKSYIGLAIQNRARAGKKQEIHYFVADVIGEKGKPTTTEEDEKNVPWTWNSPTEVLAFFKKQIPLIAKENYAMQFNGRTHLAAFEKYLEESKQ